MSRPRFARRVRGRRALTLAFAPRLIIQLSGGCQILTSTNREKGHSFELEALAYCVAEVPFTDSQQDYSASLCGVLSTPAR